VLPLLLLGRYLIIGVEIKTTIASRQGEAYPLNLKDFPDSPQRLYIKGKILERDLLAVAIVGTRQATDLGRKRAYDFSHFLAEGGVTIVSGLARGIDTVCHQAALDAGGRTFAVLASGLDRIYPPENRTLAQKISQNGALITEFSDGTKPLPKNFLARNRIISGLSLAVLVVEGKKRSGTISTAGWAADQNREVFAIPGSEATDLLISLGARICQNPKDILDYLGYELNNR